MGPAMLKWKLLFERAIEVGGKGHKRNKRLRKVQIETIWNALNYFQQMEQMLANKLAKKRDSSNRNYLEWQLYLTFNVQIHTKVVLTFSLSVRFISTLFGRMET